MQNKIVKKKTFFFKTSNDVVNLTTPSDYFLSKEYKANNVQQPKGYRIGKNERKKERKSE